MKIAILGCGHMGCKIASALRKMRDAGEDIRLYAAASRDLEKAKAFCEAEEFEVAYGSYEEMLSDPQVDLVHICTPHSHHFAHTKLCFEYGKPALVEKTFTTNAHQARELVKLSHEKNLLLAEAIWTRYMPSRKIIADLIADGTLGDVKYVTANLHYAMLHKPRIVSPDLAGGALMDVGIYPIHFAAMFLGTNYERMETSVQWHETGVDAQETINLYYPNGCAAQLSAGAVIRSDRRGMIAGSRGYLEIDNVNNPTKLTLFLAQDGWTVPHEVDLPPQQSGYEYQIRACQRALAEGRIECPEMPHDEIIRVMEMMDEVRSQWGLTFPCE